MVVVVAIGMMSSESVEPVTAPWASSTYIIMIQKSIRGPVVDVKIPEVDFHSLVPSYQPLTPITTDLLTWLSSVRQEEAMGDLEIEVIVQEASFTEDRHHFVALQLNQDARVSVIKTSKKAWDQ